MNRLFRITALLLLASCVLSPSLFAAKEKTPVTLIYFYSPSCHRCTATRADVMPLVEHHFSARLKVEYRDITDVENYKMLFTLKQQLKADEKSVFPVLYISGKFMDGRYETDLTYEAITSFVAQGMGREEHKIAATATTADIEKHFHSLAPLAIMAAGFVDGINPCAFTVIVFFMSFLFFQGYKRKSIAAVGISFIVAVFITYLLLGMGFFATLHAMKGYTLITRIIGMSIGVASIIFGVISVYDAFIFIKKGESEAMVLQLPKSIKQRIHAIVGDQYRVKKDAPARPTSILALIGGALAVGFIISIFESVCTGQLYVPTIIYVLKTSPYKLKAFALLFLYNLMFIIPLLVIYILALAGVSSNSFAGAMKKNMFLIKLFLAVMFIFLGISLVHADDSVVTTEKEQVRSQTVATAPSGQPELKIDPNAYDFGVVKEGAVLTHAFVFKNTESETITIKEVNTSCACATPKVSANTVKPGEEISIEITFDTKGYSGKKKRHLFVHTDSKKNSLVIFEIQADVQ